VEQWEEEGMETTLLKKNNSIQDSVGNEQNGYPVRDHNKMMINVTKEPSDAHKKTLTEEILEEISEKLMEKILDMVNQNLQEISRNFKTPKIMNMRRQRNK
jgi:predicted metal-dependent hydrolase